MASFDPRRLSRRSVIGGMVIGMGAAAAALAGCAPVATQQPAQGAGAAEVVEPTAATQAPAGPVTLTYYHWIDADRLGKFNDWVAPFIEANPDIMIQLIPAMGSNIENRQKLQAMMLAGTPPDLAGYAPPDFYWQGMVINLDPLIERDNYDISDISQGLIDRASYKGSLYNFPLQAGGNNPIMAYNKTLFEEAGVEPPPKTWNDPAWTWDEWVSRLIALTQDKDGDGEIDVYGLYHTGWTMSHTRQWNIWWINVDDMKTITADTPELLDCYTHIADLYCKHKVVPSSEVTEGWGPVNAFLGGMTAMNVPGSWEYQALDRSEIDWDFAPFPKPANGNTNAEMDPDEGGAIVNGSKNVDAAWEFIKWFDDGNFFRYWGGTPARPRFVEEWGKVTFSQHTDINYMLLVDALNYSREQDRITLHPCWGEMYGKVISPKWQQVTLCNLSVEQFLAESQVELQAISDTCQQKAF